MIVVPLDELSAALHAKARRIAALWTLATRGTIAASVLLEGARAAVQVADAGPMPMPIAALGHRQREPSYGWPRLEVADVEALAKIAAREWGRGPRRGRR